MTKNRQTYRYLIHIVCLGFYSCISAITFSLHSQNPPREQWHGFADQRAPRLKPKNPMCTCVVLLRSLSGDLTLLPVKSVRKPGHTALCTVRVCQTTNMAVWSAHAWLDCAKKEARETMTTVYLPQLTSLCHSVCCMSVLKTHTHTHTEEFVGHIMG